MADDFILQTRGLTKEFKGFSAVQDVNLSVKRGSVSAELQLGEAAKFFPTDAALASWMAQADQGLAQIVYE